MPDRGLSVAVSLVEHLPAAPHGVEHWASQELNVRLDHHDGKEWTAFYRAQHDGSGWLVQEAYRHRVVSPFHTLEAIEAVWRALMEVLESVNQDLPGMEVLAAKLGTPGTTDQVTRMKWRRAQVKFAAELFGTVLAEARHRPPPR